MAGLLCFGLGYSARALARHLPSDRWTVIGTAREVDTQGCLRFDRDHPLPTAAFEGITHILVSIPPDEDGDPVHDCHAEDIAALSGLDWLGYLSTTGVYGNRDGGWVEEGSELRPTSARGERRVAAEVAWRELWRTHGVPVHIFRLAGIYGPGRSAFDAMRAGTARRFERPGQVFSRIHVDDLAAMLAASIACPRPGAVYNVCDDAPAAPEAVIAHAATMLGVAAPPLEPFDAAALSPMARSFWADNKRVSNALVKKELGIELRYPDFRAGLAAILAGGG